MESPDDKLIRSVDSANKYDIIDAINKGANIDVKGPYGRPLLIIILQKYSIRVSTKEYIAQLLIREGVDMNLKDRRGATALIETANPRMMYPTIALLLMRAGAEVNAQSNDGSTVLLRALRSYDVGSRTLSTNASRIAQLAILFGADVNIGDNTDTTPLMVVAKKGDEDMVNLLIENRAELDLQDDHGRTAENLAASNDHTNILDIIEDERMRRIRIVPPVAQKTPFTTLQNWLE